MTAIIASQAKGIRRVTWLRVRESQISRHERDEYHGVTLERAGRIFDALNVTLHTKVKLEQSEEMALA